MLRSLYRAFGNRISAIARRSRIQVIWMVCLTAGVFFLYVQFVPPTDKDFGIEDIQPKPRSLHSYRKSEEVINQGLDKAPVLQRVKFIDNDYVQNRIKENEDYHYKNIQLERQVGLKSFPEENVQIGAEALIMEQNKKAPYMPPVYEVPAPAQVQLEDLNIQSDDSQWMGGNVKYNSFGGPQYEHTGHPNYIPKQRVVHFDLKGAPPKSSILIKLIPWLAKYGATAILIEYEDMFPWDGTLISLAAKNHYTKKEIRQILKACKDSNIDVIPLVQTFGHMEFALKGRLFSYLREIPEIPQALCPSKNDSSLLVRAMIDQVMRLHKEVKYLHIGCDEVFQLGNCDKCRMQNRETLFLNHVAATARYVQNAYGLKSLIWHDMLSHVSASTMKSYHFSELVEPMVWVYAEDIYRFAQPPVWTKLAETFPFVWAASAFKGAFDEQAIAPNVRRHLDNNLNWLDVMSIEGPKFSGGFRGLVLTGWQRFDHFAVLCETLPAAMPSLAVNLISVSHGHFDIELEDEIQESLKCVQASQYQNSFNLDSDPFLWEKFSWCFFPGAQVFKLMSRVKDMKQEVRAYLDKVKTSRAWITDYNIRHNFSSPMRVDEDLDEVLLKRQTLEMMINSGKEGFSEWFDGWTTGEWIEQHIWPLIKELNKLQREASSMKEVKVWPIRPLPIIPELAKYDVTEPPIKKKSSKKRSQIREERSPDRYEDKKLQYIPYKTS